MIKNLLYFAFCLMPALSPAKNLSSKIHIPVEKYKLKNGMRILLNQDRQTSLASYFLGFSVGSRREKPGITGISHMFEHLMFKGTKKYPHFDKLYLSEGFINVNAFTSRDYTAYMAGFPPEKLELALSVESDRMSQLTFTQEELEKERGAVQEERLLRVDNNPIGALYESLFDLLFEKHPYRWPVIGYQKDIAAYTLEDLNKWYKAYYAPNNAILAISGNFSERKAKKLIKKYFGPLAPQDLPEEIPIAEPEGASPRYRAISKQVEAPVIAIAYQIPPIGSKEFVALEAFSHILGVGESSILYKKMVRESELLSQISSSTLDWRDHGVFLIAYPLLDLSKEELVKEKVLETIKRGIAQGLSGKALEKAKNIQMNDMIYSLKSSGRRAGQILKYEILLGDYKKAFERLDMMEEMSLEFMRETAKKYLDGDRLSYIILRPEQGKSKPSAGMDRQNKLGPKA